MKVPDIIRKEITGIACNKNGIDTRKYYWYVFDEEPISEHNCRFWQKNSGYDPAVYGCYRIITRKLKRGGYQATWLCSYETIKSKRNAVITAIAPVFSRERKFVKCGTGHRGSVVNIDHLHRSRTFKRKQKYLKKCQLLYS